MLADLLIGLSLWTATSVLAALALGRIMQRGRIPGRPDSPAASDHHLSDVA